MAIQAAGGVGVGGNHLIYRRAGGNVRVDVSGGIVTGGTGACTIGGDIMECLDVIHGI